MSEGVETLGYRQELKRSLSFWHLLVYGLVFIGPIAPVAVFGIVFDASRGMVPLAYLVGLAAMLFTGASYAAMARLYPVAGSAYAYATRSLGATIGFFAGWALLLDYLLLPTLSNIVCAIAVHAMLPWVPQWAMILGLLAFTTGVNFLGIESTARVSLFLLVLQMTIFLVFVGAALVALARGTAGAHLSLLPFYNSAAFSPGLVAGAAAIGILSFLGFDAISTLAEEAEGGADAIAKATIVSLCIAAGLFVTLTWLASLFVLGRTGFGGGEAADAGFYAIAGTVGGSWLKFVIAFPGILLGATAGSLAAQAATARLIYGMARDRSLPAWLAHVHPTRKVPERAVFLVAAVSLLLGLGFASRFSLLSSMVCFGALLGFVLVNASLIAHRLRRRAAAPAFAAPALGLAITTYVLLNTDPHARIAGLAWLALGVAFLIGMKAAGRRAELVEI